MPQGMRARGVLRNTRALPRLLLLLLLLLLCVASACVTKEYGVSTGPT